jgi:hypothetical protein
MHVLKGSIPRRIKSVSTIPERVSAAATSLRGRLRANNRRGRGAGKARNTGARERSLSITITQKPEQHGVRSAE